MIKAIIFDLDGTVADTICAIREGVNLTMEQLGYPTRTEADIRRFINHGARELIRMSLPEDVGTDPVRVDEALDVYQGMYERTYKNTNRCYDGMVDAMTALAQRYKLAILSNKQDRMVKGLAAQLLPAGVVQIAQGQVEGVPTKPDPTAVWEICRALDVAPKECAFVGDSDVDMRTAINAGCLPVGVEWGYRGADVLLSAGAKVLVEKPCDLFGVIKGL
ncbi:MAG: HAD family hydrolase [Ruminococcaceae bacterium]|nr:HAD family hydrolase [Oscillospiraceae bacterium]